MENAGFGGAPEKTAGTPGRPYVRRRNYFVKKWLQSRYIIYYLAIMASSSILLFFLVQDAARDVLRTEMSMGHSFVLNTWSILKPEIVRVNALVVAIVVAGAVVATWTLSWSVRRAAHTVAANLGAFRRGEGVEGWRSVGRPREFQRLQDLLADSISAHRSRLERLRVGIADLESASRTIRDACREGKDTLKDDDLRALNGAFAGVKKEFGPFKGGEKT